jgi:hypothetical protein
MQVSVCGCEVSLLCVCVYRCVQLRELTVEEIDIGPFYGIYNISEDGIRMVITHCNELRILKLRGLRSVTGMCALCEMSEPTWCFITLWCMIFLGSSSLTENA